MCKYVICLVDLPLRRNRALTCALEACSMHCNGIESAALLVEIGSTAYCAA